MSKKRPPSQPATTNKPTARRKPTQKKTAKKKPVPKNKPGVGPQRLNKVLAAAGLGSRREVEELIVQGRVEIDRDVVADLACKVDPKEVTIKVDGQTVKRFRPVYFVLNKPKGVLSTNKDPSGRTRVIDLVPDDERVFSVGRLDRNSEGLTLLTNDGELAQKLAHPKYRIQKTYFVVVAGMMTKEELAKLRKGVYLAEGFARIDGATIRKQRKGSTELEIVLSEGKNREIRRILARAGHKVIVLRRIAIGSLRLGQLPVGASRSLTSGEVQALYSATNPNQKMKPAPKKSAKSAKHGAKRLKQSAASANDPLADDIDDDFVGDFSGTTNVGSVLTYDESPPKKTGTKKKPSKSGRSQSARSKPSTRGSRSRREGTAATTGAKRGTPAARPTKKSAAKSTTAKRTAAKRSSSKKTSDAKKPSRRGGSRPASNAKRSSSSNKRSGGKSKR